MITPRKLYTLMTSIPAVLMLMFSLQISSTSAQMRITGVVDGPLSGGTPKAVEVYVLWDIPDLSLYGLGAANNGGGSDGEEFRFPGIAANAGDFIYVASQATQFTAFFGFAPDYISDAASINGDDAIELFQNGVVIDVLGEINVDGTGTPWEYQDGWVYRKNGSGPDGALFDQNNWIFSGPNALDGETTNANALLAFPIATYAIVNTDVPPTVSSTNPIDGADDVAQNSPINITFSEAVIVNGSWFNISCTISGAHSAITTSFDDTTYFMNTQQDFVENDSCQVIVFAAQVADTDGSLDNMQADFEFSFTVPAPPQMVRIHEIQGAGAMSPLAGQTLIVEGIVTGDFQDGDANQQSNLRGIYVQEEAVNTDANPLTSEGVFVFMGSISLDVNPGDRVQVTGVVTEFFGETQISASEVNIMGSGNVSATAITLPTQTVIQNDRGNYIADLEQYEGMLVTFTNMLTVSDLFNLDRFGELRLTQGERVVQFTHNNTPNAAGLDAHLQNFARRSIMLDDGLTIQNPDPIRYPAPGLPNMLGAAIRAGDGVVSVTGNIRFSKASGGSGDEAYRLMPTEHPEFIANNPRPESMPQVGGSLRLASLNLLNYFTTLDGNGAICGPNMSQGCRGADNQTEFDRQHGKILNALLAMNADVFALVELENSTGVLQSLVAAMNTVAGSGSYAFVNTATIGTDAIRVGLIYRVASVSTFGAHALLDSSVDPTFNDDKNRPALAQSFIQHATAGVFTVVVNHLKSKGSNCNSLNDPDLGDGQGNCNATRTLAAVALANWLATDPTSSNDPDIMIMGDLNAYMREDPVIAIEYAGYSNLIDAFIGPTSYSFLFNGQIGTLDYALASAELLGQVTGVGVWHINADEADATDYNLDFGRNPDIFDASTAFRASDHDPIIVGLHLSGDKDADGVQNAADECPMTSSNALVNPANGCSLPQLVPCDEPKGSTVSWKNHGQYVSTIAYNAGQFEELGLISADEKGAIVVSAARSSCGHKIKNRKNNGKVKS